MRNIFSLLTTCIVLSLHCKNLVVSVTTLTTLLLIYVFVDFVHLICVVANISSTLPTERDVAW